MKKMKKILLLLLFTIASYGQAVFDEGIQIKNNTTDNSATKVNVQSTDGTINTISKSDLVNVVEVNDVPSLPLIGEVGKIYVVRNLNKIYRWNGAFYQELAVTDISGLQAQIDLKENSVNKQNSLVVDGTGTKYPTVDAVNTLKKYTKEITVGIGGTYATLELLFANEPAGKTLIKLTDANYTSTNPQFVVKTGWILQGQGYGKTNLTFNFTAAIDPNLSGLQIRTDCELVDFKVTSVNDTNSGGFSQYALHSDYVGAFTAKITRCWFKTVASPNVVDANGYNGLSVGIGTWEGQNIEFHESILQSQSVAIDNKYTLNLHNTYVNTLHSTPSRVSFYNCQLTGGFTTVLISDTYSNDSEPNNTRVKDLFEFVGCEIKGGIWLRSHSQIGTVDKKNGINYNFSGTVVDEFLNTSESVDTSLSNYDVNSLPITKDVIFEKNIGASTISAGDFVAYVYANRLPEYHLTSEKTISVPIGVEKLSSLNYKNFAGISLVSSLAGNYCHIAKGAIAYTSLTSTSLIIGDNVNFDSSGNLVKANGSGIGKVVRKTYDNRLGISLLSNGETTNVIGNSTNRGLIEVAGNASTVGAPTLRISDYNGGYYGWQSTVGTNANTPIAIDRGRYAINDLDKGIERLGIDIFGTTFLTGRGLTVENLSIDTDPYTHFSLGTASKPGYFKLANGYNLGNGFEIYQAGTGKVYFNFNNADNAIILDPASDEKLQVNGGVKINNLAGTGTRRVVADASGNLSTQGVGYRVYTALLTQTGTNAPVATVLENTLGGTVVWSRTGTGVYRGILTGAFTSDKTFQVIGASNTSFILLSTSGISEVVINTYKSSGTTSDGFLSKASYEIRVYN